MLIPKKGSLLYTQSTRPVVPNLFALWAEWVVQWKSPILLQGSAQHNPDLSPLTGGREQPCPYLEVGAGHGGTGWSDPNLDTGRWVGGQLGPNPDVLGWGKIGQSNPGLDTGGEEQPGPDMDTWNWMAWSASDSDPWREGVGQSNPNPDLLRGKGWGAALNWMPWGGVEWAPIWIHGTSALPS